MEGRRPLGAYQRATEEWPHPNGRETLFAQQPLDTPRNLAGGAWHDTQHDAPRRHQGSACLRHCLLRIVKTADVLDKDQVSALRLGPVIKAELCRLGAATPNEGAHNLQGVLSKNEDPRSSDRADAVEPFR
ncbi:MAG: hypothetical protein JO110_04665 [Acetobacteraceae bacterium]|nr:hypothetical protein [Acetobacteraceae bacterium]